MKAKRKIACLLSGLLVFSSVPNVGSAEWEPSGNLANPLQPVVAFVAEEDPPVLRTPLDQKEREFIEQSTQKLLSSIDQAPLSTSSLEMLAEDAQTFAIKLSSASESDGVRFENLPSGFRQNSQLGRPVDLKSSTGDVSGREKDFDGRSTQIDMPLSRPGETSDWGKDGAPSTSPSLAPVLDRPDVLNFLLEEQDRPLSRADSSGKSLSAKTGSVDAENKDLPQGAMWSLPEQGVNVIDSVRFTDKMRMIYELMNPPDGLHPWLKWLLYSSRLSKEMISLYYSTLKKRDEIYQRALQSQGKLAILYKNKIFKDMPIFVMPEWGGGDYALVKLGGDHRDAQSIMMAQVNPSST